MQAAPAAPAPVPRGAAGSAEAAAAAGGAPRAPLGSTSSAARLEVAIEKDLSKLARVAKADLRALEKKVEATETEVISEIEDLGQGVRETLRTEDFDMGKVLGATTYFYMILLKWLMGVCLVGGAICLPLLRMYFRGGYSSRVRRDRRRLSFAALSPFCMDYEMVVATAGVVNSMGISSPRRASRRRGSSFRGASPKSTGQKPAAGRSGGSTPRAW